MPATLPDVMAPFDALTVWLASRETREQMQAAVSEAVAAVEQRVVSNHSLRVPRKFSERENGFRPWLEAFFAGGFEQWLNSYKHQLARQVQSEVLSAFPATFTQLQNKELIRETVETLIWPEIEPLLRERAENLLLTYAVRGLALSWVVQNLGDGLLLGVPEEQNTKWHVPLHNRFTQERIAEVLLSRDGEMLSNAGALRTALGMAQ